MDDGVCPDSSAAAAVTSLKVEPGGKISRTARFFNGSAGSLTREFQFCASVEGSEEANRFGS